VAKLKEMNITEGLETPEITVVEKAELPRAPISSRRNMNLVMSAIIGLVFAMGLAFFLEYLDVGLSTREEAEKFLELPVLGVIPQTQTRN
jgi:capsular polysaccharide biosynthesis protein